MELLEPYTDSILAWALTIPIYRAMAEQETSSVILLAACRYLAATNLKIWQADVSSITAEAFWGSDAMFSQIEYGVCQGLIQGTADALVILSKDFRDPPNIIIGELIHVENISRYESLFSEFTLVKLWDQQRLAALHGLK